MVLAQRLTAQLLTGAQAPDCVAVAERLLAVQAQDLRAARLAIRSRSTGLTSADIDRALTEERSLLVSWLNRGTLHLVRREDYPWLQALTAPTLRTTIAQRLGRHGVSDRDAERGLRAIERALAREGPLDRDGLRKAVAAAGLAGEGQAFVQLLVLASIRGLIVRGPILDGEHAFVLVSDWLGDPPAIDRDAALAELARRYLRGHGPATDRDLARWSGLSLGDVRAGLRRIASELDQRPDGLLDLKGRGPAEPLPAPKLLGGFEPVLLGWCSRGEILGGVEPQVVVGGGIFRPIALARGRAVATWRLAGSTPQIEPFDPLSAEDREALAADGADVTRFLSG